MPKYKQQYLRAIKSGKLLILLTDRWPSGRRRTPGKCVGGRPSPGFESLSVRHHILPIPVPVISGTIPAQDQGFTTAFCD